jgi:DNA repair protein RadC
MRSGAEGFSDHELLELLLTYSIPRRDIKPVAKRLLATLGSLPEVLNSTPQRLCLVDGIGEQSAVLIRLVRDFHRPSVLQPVPRRQEVDSTREAVAVLRAEFSSSTEEEFGVLLLDVDGRLLRVTRLATGTIDRATVYPRAVAAEAIRSGAAAIILGHSHPRAASDPSPADLALTRQLVLALTPIGVDLLDHVILGDGEYYSFASRGDLDSIRAAYREAIDGH